MTFLPPNFSFSKAATLEAFLSQPLNRYLPSAEMATATNLSKKVAIIILVYGPGNYLKDCINSVLKADGEVSVLVLDNGSNDRVVQSGYTSSPQVRFFRSEINFGFAGGNNLLAAWAISQGYEYLFFLNDDTLVEEGFLNNALGEFGREGVGIVGSLLVEGSNPEIIQEAGAVLDSNKMTFAYQYVGTERSQLHDSEFDVSSICGAGFLVPSQLFAELGGFDPIFFCLFEDTDLCLRTRKLGKKVVLAFNSVVKHFGSQTLLRKSPFTYYLATRNELLLIRKHSVGAVRFTSLLRQIFFNSGRRGLLALVRDRDLNLFFATLRGIFRGLTDAVHC